MVIKRVLPEYANLEDFSRMFAEEAEVAALLTHPNIVQVFDFGNLRRAPTWRHSSKHERHGEVASVEGREAASNTSFGLHGLILRPRQVGGS